MYKKILIIILVLFSINKINSQESRWDRLKDSDESSFPYQLPENFIVFQLDEQALVNDLIDVPDWKTTSAINSKIQINIPNLNGEMMKFSISEASVMEPDLQAQFPNMRSYIGQGIGETKATLRMSYSNEEGFDAMIRTVGKPTLFFTRGNNKKYAFYHRLDRDDEILNCTTLDLLSNSNSNSSLSARDSNTGELSIFRLALTCNGEYGAWAGGTIATVLAKFNTTMTRVNGIYEQELAIHINIINQNSLIYLNASTDPYTGLNNTQIHNNITTVAGSSNFDIGHLFGQGGDGGNAGCIGCVCNTANKAGGYTSRGNPQGDTFDIDYVAHEMGHQFGGNHTFTSAYNGSESAPANEGVGANLEPGSGSTIMAYAGITGSNNHGISTDVQPNSDDYFHFFNIQQISDYIATTSCQTTDNLSQATPTVNAGSNYTIPKNTAFILTGSGTADGTPTYCWEQNDLGGYSEVTTLPTPSSTSGPSFRSLSPTVSPKRYFPKFETVVSGSTQGGAIGSKWEALNTVARLYKFKVTIRDNVAGGAQNKIDAMQVTVKNVGPFMITSQTAEAAWITGESKTVTWDVAGTTANNINTSNVKISLVDLDGSELAVLMASTSNDGSEAITVPNITDGSVRVMVSAIGNIFYAINSTNLAINTEIEVCTDLCASSGTTTYETGTTLVNFNTINKSSGKPSGYSDYTNISTTVEREGTYDLTVNVNTDGPYKVVTKVWIDWNRDCNFDGSGEEYDLGDATGVADGATSNSPLSIMVPANASIGSTIMRVSSKYNSTSTSCQTGFDGEVEDYTIIVDYAAATNDITNFDNFVLSPNPNNGNFNIKLTSDNNDISVVVYDMLGREIHKQNFDNNQSNFNQNINLNTIEAGIYLVLVSDGVKFNSERVIIK